MIQGLKEFLGLFGEILSTTTANVASKHGENYQDKINKLNIDNEEAQAIYLNLILNHVANVKRKIPPQIGDFAGAGIHLLLGNLTGIDEYRKMAKISSLNSHPKEKFARLMLDGVFKEATNVSRLLTLLTITAVVPQGVAAIMTPVAGFALAAGAWGATAFAAVRVARAVKKYRDPSIWLEHTLTKIDKIDAKLEKLHAQLEIITTKSNSAPASVKLKNKSIKLNKEIESLTRKRKDLKEIALTIGHEKFIKPIKLIPTHLQGKWDKITQETSLDDINKDRSLLMKELEKNQREIIANRTVAMISMATAAVGLTLIAAAPFCAVAAPAVMAAGFTIMALGAAIQVGHTLTQKLIHHKAMTHKYNELRHELYKDVTKKFDPNDSISTSSKLSPKMQLRYQLAFEYDQSMKKEPTQDKGAWFKSLNENVKSPRELKKYLKVREAKMLNDMILRQALNIGKDQPLPDLPDKVKTQIIQRHCRHSWKKDLKHFFFAKLKKPDSAQDGALSNLVPKNAKANT